MRATDVHELFREAGTWIDWSDAADGFRFGDPETEVTGIVSGWKPYWADLKRAKQLGCDLFIGHESIFREGPMDPVDEGPFASELEHPKLEWLRESGMVVYRCHDLWDSMPEIGVRDSWARGLGFGEEAIAFGTFWRLQDASGHTFGSLAAQVAERVKSVGQSGVLAVGDERRPVTRLALMGGAAMLTEMLERGADVVVTYDDYFRQVRDGALLEDLGVPYVIVNHGALEEWGVANLAPWLAERLPDVPVHHAKQGCVYRIVS